MSIHVFQRLIDGLRGDHRTIDSDGTSIAERDLLTDEETVIVTLRDHEGVAWQSHIGAETDWSESKVSRVLCRMEDDGDVRRYRVGRRNLVSLPGREPEYLREERDSLAS